VGMGSTVIQAEAPQTQMLAANRALRVILHVISTGRMARPMMWGRPPGLAKVDQFYYTTHNVDDRTIDRFYGYTLEDTGRGALHQLDPYLARGQFLSADRKTDYSDLLPRVTVPLLMCAGESDVMSDIRSTQMTFDGVHSTDKTLLR